MRIGTQILTIALATVIASGSPPEPVERLTADLGKPWTVLTISRLFDQGCVAPIFVGVRIRRYESGMTIAPWREEQGKQIDGETRNLAESDLKPIVDSLTRHYQAALTSIDINEHIASFPTQAEQAKALKEAIKAMGGMPIGGFGGDGINIRIQGYGMADQQYSNCYGATDGNDFRQWMEALGAKWATSQ